MGFFDILSDVIGGGSKILRGEMDRQRRREAEFKRNHGGSSSSSSYTTSSSHKNRGTKEDFRSDKTGMDKRPEDFSHCSHMSLKDAKVSAPSEPGVYILYLHGSVMKCGVATYSQGISWRFTQYYNLNYDDRARKGEYWSISPENRDEVTVAWQACPKRVCDELEYKLFRKYGKGPWAKRAPSKLGTDEWKLLI